MSERTFKNPITTLEKIKSIDEIYVDINKCENCNLCEQRIINYYPGGSVDAKIALIGEAPGGNEQKEGTFFIGRSGKLLRKLLTKAGIDDKKDVYITNLVKDRPPDNRNPFWDEIKACSPFLIEELRIINPKLIITLGRVSGNWYANGREWEWNTYYKDRRFFPMYHPSYLLRNIEEREMFPEHLRRVLDECFN